MTGGTLRATSSVRVRGTKAAGVTAAPAPVTSIAPLSYGTGTARIDTEIVAERYLAAGASETLDLFTGTDLVDVFGDAAPLRLVKFLEVGVADGGDPAGLRIGGASSNAWGGFFADTSDKHLVFPDGPSYRGGSPAGVAVGGTTCNLKIENLGAVGVTYSVVVGGSAAAGGTPIGLLLGLTYP